MPLTVKLDFSQAIRKLNIAKEQLPFAAALALTRTAQQAKLDEIQAMKSSFVHVVPYTLLGIYIEKATKASLIAYVGIKGKQAQWLGTEIVGGQRDLGLEKFLRNIGLPPAGMYAVPGPEAKLVGGKVSISWLEKITANIIRDEFGVKQRRIRMGTLSSNQVFALTERRANLPPGIYARKGRRVLPLIFFVGRAVYRAKYDFYGVGQQTALRVFDALARKAALDAMATAR